MLLAFNYYASANTDDGSCIAVALGCIDATAFNYDASANTDDGSCIAVALGCIDATAFNYDASANTDDGSCIPFFGGCTDSNAVNYNPVANTDDGSCVILGCTGPSYCNYDSLANVDDGTCSGMSGCIDPLYAEYDPIANCDDGSCITLLIVCIEDAPTGLFASDVIHTRATINWDNMNSGSCFVDQYRIQYRVLGSSSWSQKTMSGPVGSCTFASQKTDKLLLGLTANSTYEYQMKAWYCGGGNSSWSTVATIYYFR